MSARQIAALNHFTKLIILLVVVVSTELDSNYGLYLATLLWLEFGKVLQLERAFINKLGIIKRKVLP